MASRSLFPSPFLEFTLLQCKVIFESSAIRRASLVIIVVNDRSRFQLSIVVRLADFGRESVR